MRASPRPHSRPFPLNFPIFPTYSLNISCPLQPDGPYVGFERASSSSNISLGAHGPKVHRSVKLRKQSSFRKVIGMETPVRAVEMWQFSRAGVNNAMEGEKGPDSRSGIRLQRSPSGVWGTNKSYLLEPSHPFLILWEFSSESLSLSRFVTFALIFAVPGAFLRLIFICEMMKFVLWCKLAF